MKKNKIESVKEKFLEYFESGMKYDEIANELNVSKSAISNYVKTHGLIHPSKRKSINEDSFDTFTEESVYWLGFLWADGYVQNTDKNKTIDLEITDGEHAEKFRAFLNVSKVVKRTRNNSTTYRVTCNSTKLVDMLYALGFNIKDKRINIPNIPIEYRLVFLRGYFDGDGHIRIKNEKFEGIDISGRIKFIDNLRNQYPYFIREEFHSSCSKRIYSNEELGKRFLTDIYKDATIFLERKYRCALLFRE